LTPLGDLTLPEASRWALSIRRLDYSFSFAPFAFVFFFSSPLVAVLQAWPRPQLKTMLLPWWR
jgi:hypothetical protein